MARRWVQPANARIDRQPIVPHDRWLDGLWTGTLEVRWKIDRDHPVVIGAGWYDLQVPLGAKRRPPKLKGMKKAFRVPVRAKPELLAEIARRGRERMPVLPGSSLKGAVRQVYELMTESCRPGGELRSCRIQPRDVAPRVCPACLLFGAPGLGGRVRFDEATPVGNWRMATKRVVTPVPWKPTKSLRPALKVYDQGRTNRAETESTWSVFGEFESRLRLLNANDEELGLLFLSLGLGAKSPTLRLGGTKFHGHGGVDVRLEVATERWPRRRKLKGPDLEAWVEEQRTAALADAGRRDVWDKLHQALAARPAARAAGRR